MSQLRLGRSFALPSAALIGMFSTAGCLTKRMPTDPAVNQISETVGTGTCKWKTMMDRNEMLAAAASRGEHWDVIVIGGGATGLGTALDAVSRGYRTILLEGSDFARGTSSRSTKLIHGGVRYLRQGQVNMVRQSLLERGRLQRNAPHLVHPLNFVVPSYQALSRWYYYAGLTAYDLLAGRLRMGRTLLLSREKTLEYLPGLRAGGLRGGIMYADGQFDDARLAICLARTIASLGGVVLNYAPVRRLVHTGGKIAGVVVEDMESGQEIVLQGRSVINATGVFCDAILKMDEDRSAFNAGTHAKTVEVVPSQGSHIVLPRKYLPSRSAMMIPETDDGRVLFAIPWHGHVLFGTTDVAVPKISEDPRPSAEELDYLLAYAARYLSASPGRSDVLSVFAGLRPLVRSQRVSGSTAAMSREHEILTSSSGLISVIGGKWTTYRHMGEQVVDLAARAAELPQKKSGTAELPLLGAANRSALSAMAGMAEDYWNDWTDARFGGQYGSETEGLQSMIAKDASLAEPVHPNLPFLKVQVQWAVRHEMARTVEDVLARRIRMLFLNAAAAIEAAPCVAEMLKSELGKSEEWRLEQLRMFGRIGEAYRIQ